MTTLRATIVTLAMCLAVGCGTSVDRDAFAAALHTALARQAGHVGDRTVMEAVRVFYEQRDNQPAWMDDEATAEAVAAIAASSHHGLIPEHYDGPSLSRAFETVDRRARKDQAATDGWATFDAQVTTALIRLGRDVSIGMAPPASIDAQWKPRITAPELGASLADAWRAGRLSTWLDTIAPSHVGYRRLRESLVKLAATQPEDEARLNVVRANLDRWRWLPADLGGRYLIANIPEFVLRAIEGDRSAFEMRVVVGGLGDRQTPLFSDVMETVVFNPYWHIPKSIAQGETAPAVAKDPDYLDNHNIEVLDAASGHRHVDPEDVDWNDKDALKSLVFRQRPGDDNALGDVKFLFPNRHAVYMHDTPSTTFFQRPMRALSHGCVRVAEPDKLAAYVLRDQPAWTATAIATNMSGDREQHVKLTQPLPVHLVYFTATVDDRGNLVFFDDVYKLDEKQLRAVRRPKV